MYECVILTVNACLIMSKKLFYNNRSRLGARARNRLAGWKWVFEKLELSNAFVTMRTANPVGSN
jgi:hypothetical protein